MRSLRLLVIFLALFSFFNTELFSQTNSGIFNYPFASDSLNGFDAQATSALAQAEGLYGARYQAFMYYKKRAFIDAKYALNKNVSLNNPAYNLSSGLKTLGGVNTILSAPCVNEGFENGSTSGWVGASGQNTISSCVYAVTPLTSPTLQVLSTPFTDNVVNITIPNSPFSGSHVLKINDSNEDWGISRIAQTFPVTNTNFLFEFAYLAVMATNHVCCDQTYMQVKLYNFNGTPLACPLFTFAPPPPTGPSCSSPGIAWTNTNVTIGLTTFSVCYNSAWQNYSIDLTNYINQNITVEVTVSDCDLGGHWGYTYFDSNCDQLGFTLNTTTFVAAASQTVNLSGLCAQTASITAPVGLGPYAWTGPTGSFTTQTIATAQPGTYTLSMNPSGSCLPITRIVNLTFPPPTTITASSSNLCASGTTTASTLTAVGASAYTWQPGGSTSSVVVVTPSSTTVYTVTAQTGTCMGTYTTQITVNPNPSINVLASNSTLCPGQSATLIANGATSYVWNPGGLTGSIVVISQSATTIYTTIGTSTSGCTGTFTTSITSATALPISIFPPTVAIICSGTAVSMIGIGAPNFTWLPDNVTGIFQTFTPTITTTYTAIGASGSCTNSAMITVTVDQGPPITISANPTITCPGNTTTLTATAPLAVGVFTWMPGPFNTSAITVTAALTGGYSVSAVNGLGCKNTQTFNPTYTPPPVVIVSPPNPSVCAGGSITLSATGALTYTWQPGGQTGASAAFTPSATSTYTVIGENGAGCTGQTTVSILVVPIPVINAAATPTAICAGSCATIVPGGASSYTISGGSFIVCPSVNTSYAIIGENGSGCISSPINVSVVVNSLPNISANANPATICAGGSSTLTALGGINYTWSTGGTAATEVVTPPSTQSFTVTGDNSFGCTNSTVVAVTVIPAPIIAVNPAASTICIGGSVSPLASGATNYTWMPGGITGSNPTFNPATSTVYTVTGSNGACTGQTLFPVTVAPSPVITATYSPGTICAGDCATLTATGSVTNYIISGLSGAVACPTITTNYSVVGVSIDGCLSNTVTGTLFVNTPPTVFATATPTAICPGDSSFVSASGALTYTWQPGSIVGSSFFAKPSVTTSYVVSGTNASGCIATATTTVVVNSVPIVGVTPSATTICPGGSTTLNGTGASTYTWMPGGTGSSIVVSPSVTTTYSVIGANGSCTGTNSVVVTVAPAPVISASFNPSSICAGSCATINATGASSYSMSGLSGVACPSVTSNYTIVGISSFGCNSLPVVGTLTVLPAPNISASANPSSICLGDSTVITGIGGVSYHFMPTNITAPFLVDHPASTTIYTVTGTDASGCTNTAVVTVTVNSVTLFAIATPTSICAGGTATLAAAGAINYNWSPGGFSGATIFVSPTVTTVYTVTGTSGVCSAVTTVTVNVDPVPTVFVVVSTPSICMGGSVNIALSGASSYQWDDGFIGSSRAVSPTVTTTYSITGFSANGCPGTATAVTIFVIPAPTIGATALPGSICAGASSTLSATGGNLYGWQPGGLNGSQIVVSPSVTTTYTVIGIDASGCINLANVTVTVTPQLNVTASANPSVLCSSVSTTLTASGATSYSWLPTSLTGPTVITTPAVSTNFTLIAVSGACSTQVIVPVIVNSSVSVNVTASTTSLCAGNCATLNASGASSYTWSNGSTGNSSVVCPTITTTYTVVGGAGSCTNLAQVTIFVNPGPNLSISGTQNTLCPNNSATLTASGATTYSWNTGPTTSVITIAPAITTVYTVTGITGGCSVSLSYTQTVVAPGNFTIVPSTSSICAGFTVGLLAVGGVGNYTWQPSGFVGNPLIDSPPSTTVYTANLNNGGCPTIATATVFVVPLPTVSLSANPQAVCAGGTTTLTATGAVTYSWIPSLAGGNTFTASPTVPTTYTVVGFDAAGCPGADTIMVSIVNPGAISASVSPNPVCVGNTATLTATGASNYTWMPGGQTGAIILVNPTANTIYTVTGGNSGCLGSATLSVAVAPLPNIIMSTSTSTICPGGTVQVNASGANTYTWNPTGLNSASIVDTPAATTSYTVIGTDANGCKGTNNISVIVNPMKVTALASPSNICAGDSTSLMATGALGYTWSPGGLTSSTVFVTPLVSTIYTLTANDGICVGIFSVAVNVTPIPTINITPQNFSVCIGSTATLAATGATNYTWLPNGSTSSVIVVNPVAPTTYTVIGNNNGLCAVTRTVTVFVNPLPSHVAATSAGTVSCSSPTAQLFGLCTDTNVSFFWASATYTTSGQNPLISGVWGTFTLSVIDNVTGCVATATVNVPTDNSIPLVTPVASGSITCAVSTVTLNAVNTTTNPGYNWAGPSAFSSTVQSPVVSLQGAYTITVTDLSSHCTATAVVIVGSHTTVAVKASIFPATCKGDGTSNNDGSISVSGFTLTDKYDLVSGNSYTGTTTYATAASVALGGILTNNLANPTSTLAYTLRLFDGQGCVKDTTLYLIPVDCSVKTLGIAKAVSVPRINSDGSYNVTYTVVVKNYALDLNNLILTENLSATFPAPTSFTVIPDSTRISANSSMQVNSALFDGSSNTNLLAPVLNTLGSFKTDTIMFTVKVRTTHFFADFKNSVTGIAEDGNHKIITDSSQAGLNPDPDNDSNPYNNNVPTVINFTPNTFFGITKIGEIHKIDNDSYDVTYTVTVHNLGNDTIRNVVLRDSLFEKTIRNPVTYSMRSAPVSSGGGLAANSAYNGHTDINLVVPGSKIGPNSTSSVYFTINIIPGTVTAISNSAYGNALAAKSLTESIIVSDTSNAGTNPDVNGNGVGNEPIDNVPTVLLVPNTHSLFIPEGFSPDGDGTNQYFVIQGLSDTGNNPITIFNRWGNKVYSSANYDNTWDGTPNVSGTLGKNKLPPGTYYYILEMKGSGIKPITGFVVLQY